jgi:hypothetical protein
MQPNHGYIKMALNQNSNKEDKRTKREETCFKKDNLNCIH